MIPKIKSGICVLLGVFLSGCASSSSALNKVHNGMTKAQVIDAIGSPKSVSSDGNVEYMNYRFATSFADFDASDTSDYFVRIRDGKVDAFGQKGDFGTTKNPTVDYNINQNVKTSGGSENPRKDDDLYTRLKRLQQLHDDKLISDEEFAKLKKQAIESSK